jgi:hypothetical protein
MNERVATYIMDDVQFYDVYACYDSGRDMDDR